MNNIQRKFLVSADIERWLKKHRSTVDKTEQFYVTSEVDTVCYYHKHFPDTYTKVMLDKTANEEISSATEKIYALQLQFL